MCVAIGQYNHDLQPMADFVVTIGTASSLKLQVKCQNELPRAMLCIPYRNWRFRENKRGKLGCSNHTAMVGAAAASTKFVPEAADDMVESQRLKTGCKGLNG
jgi:hypothetical protein